MKKLILNFNSKDSKKIKNPKNFLGGKGANLSEMGRMGLPVPPGFTISTKVCEIFYKDKKKLNKNLISQIKKELKLIEKDVSKKFGDLKNPLLLSVRSGARVSMPGMMDTILNLGLNDKTVKALAIKTSNGRFAKDSYRRFIQMYGNVVMGVEGYHFEELIENYKLTKGVLLDTDLDESDWDGLIEDFKRTVREKAKKDFPQDVHEQLLGAISAVFLSWESNRAKVYRKLNQIPAEWGTAVNVQSMVFGNMGDDCATGVVFTRNPSDGSNEIYGEYLINAQGEDVVAGTRTPQYITKKARRDAKVKELSMEESMPKVFKELQKILKKLEMHYKDMQDVEFTVENSKLWMLQTRSGKRTAKSAVKIAVDMVKEKLISKKEAVLRIDPNSLDTLLHPTLDEKSFSSIAIDGGSGALNAIATFNTRRTTGNDPLLTQVNVYDVSNSGALTCIQQSTLSGGTSSGDSLLLVLLSEGFFQSGTATSGFGGEYDFSVYNPNAANCSVASIVLSDLQSSSAPSLADVTSPLSVLIATHSTSTDATGKISASCVGSLSDDITKEYTYKSDLGASKRFQEIQLIFSSQSDPFDGLTGKLTRPVVK